MKIRTDFVTNSSSSSYCVSFIVKTAADKKLELNFYPEDEDGSNDVTVSLNEDVDSVVDSIKACGSVEELRDLLLNALDLYDLFNRMSTVILDEYGTIMDNTQLLEAISKIIKNDEDGDFENYEDTLNDAQQTISKFKGTMDKIEDLSDIKSVGICEYFSGWGEFARDGVAEFLDKALPKDVDIEDADAVRAAFEGKLPEADIDCIVDQIEDDVICEFNADITTTIQIADGKVEKTYRFDSDD